MGNVFDVEEDSGCNYDFLEIGSGSDRFCGEGIDENPVVHYTQELTLNFHSDDETEERGFQLEYSLISVSKANCAVNCVNGGCYETDANTCQCKQGWQGNACDQIDICGGETEVSEASGTIQSPGRYGHGNYPNYKDCNITIRAGEGRLLVYIS